MCGCLLRAPYWGTDPDGDPGMCPDWEWNWPPFGSQTDINPLSHTSQGWLYVFDVTQCNFITVFSVILVTSFS